MEVKENKGIVKKTSGKERKHRKYKGSIKEIRKEYKGGTMEV